MGNFARVVRLALRYYWTVAASVVCALIVAVLWGGNIGFLYPIVEVVGLQQSLGEWVDKSIAESRATIAEQSDAEAKLEQRLAAAPSDEKKALSRALRTATTRREAAEGDLGRSEWLKPWIDAYLPDDPFQTLALLVALLLVATVVKDSFLAASAILADRVAQLATYDLRKEFYRRTLRMDLLKKELIDLLCTI